MRRKKNPILVSFTDQLKFRPINLLITEITYFKIINNYYFDKLVLAIWGAMLGTAVAVITVESNLTFSLKTFWWKCRESRTLKRGQVKVTLTKNKYTTVHVCWLRKDEIKRYIISGVSRAARPAIFSLQSEVVILNSTPDCKQSTLFTHKQRANVYVRLQTMLFLWKQL